jgi:hypothetical protein
VISGIGSAAPPPDFVADDVRALEALIIGNPDFDELELLLSEFNLFEAVGMVRQELRHSEFLAFLLDPNQNHGLGDAFVTRLLQSVLLSARGSAVPVSPLDFDVWSLKEVTVQREWKHIDILLLHEEHGLAVVIENKIDSSEHSDQLKRYREAVQRAHPTKRFFGIYLTPDGDTPSHPAYIPCSYSTVAKAIEDLMASRRSTMGEDVRMALRHYHEMLHRHIMSESKVAELCQRIYRKHQRALDLIFEHRPDVQSEISAFLRELIDATPGLRYAGGAKAMVRATAEQWDEVETLESTASPTGRLLYFEFYNGPNQLTFGLYMGPGETELRQRLLELALHGEAARPTSDKLGKDWKTLRSWKYLNAAAYTSASPAELIEQIHLRWTRFVEEELQPILDELSTDRVRQALTLSLPLP